MEKPIILFQNDKRRMVVDLHPFSDENPDRTGRVRFKTAVAAVALPFAPVISLGVASSAIADLVTKIEDQPDSRDHKSGY